MNKDYINGIEFIDVEKRGAYLLLGEYDGDMLVLCQAKSSEGIANCLKDSAGYLPKSSAVVKVIRFDDVEEVSDGRYCNNPAELYGIRKEPRDEQ